MKYNEWAANKSESSKKAQLRKDINQTIRIVSTYSEFLAFMEAKGYEIKNAEFGENSRKYITFRSPDMSHPVRGSTKSLGKILLRNVSKNALIISSTELLFLLFVIS